MTALMFVDGFDKYGPTGNLNVNSVLGGDWVITSGSPLVVAPLSATGYATQMGSGGSAVTLTGVLPLSLPRVVGSVRLNLTVSTAFTPAIIFNSGGTSAFSVTFTPSTGHIVLRTGNIGTAIATSATGVVPLNTTHVVSWDVTVGAAGAYAVYLDGLLLLSGTGNTGNGLTTVNTVVLQNTNTAVGVIWDDFCVFNPADPAYNSAVLTNNVVVETSFPNGDAQKQFTNDGNVLWATGIAANGVYRANPSVSGLASNAVHLLKVTPVTNCTLNSVSFTVAAGGATKLRGAVYNDVAGAPSLLLSSGVEITSPNVVGATYTSALVTPQSLTAGTPVWIGFHNETAFNIYTCDGSVIGRRAPYTYASGAPAGPLTGIITGNPTYLFWGNCTGAASNFASELLNPPLGTAQSQVRSSTVGQEDLYTFPALTTTPSAIYGVAVKGYVAKSDSGNRTISLNMKSGASDSTGSNPAQAMSTTSQWQRSHFDVDPATGAAWTAAGLNGASSGVSIAS